MYKTELITDNSYTEIQKLYHLSFDFFHSLTYIKNKYDTECFGLKNLGLIAKNDNNELAAYYGVFPIILNYELEDYLVAQSGDTMTAPVHRKKGLFTKLAKETYSLAQKKGVNFIFGFPNENSYPGFERKLNWKFYGFMQRFTFKIKTIPFCELAAKFEKLLPLYKSFVQSRIAKYKIDIDQIDFDSFNYSVAKGQIKKNRDFFGYKLNGENTFVVLIEGIQILIKVSTHLFIGEVSKIEYNQAILLIKCVKKLARRLGCIKVIFTLSKNHWLFDVLIQNHTSTKSLPIGFYLMNDTFAPEEIQFSNADYDTF